MGSWATGDCPGMSTVNETRSIVGRGEEGEEEEEEAEERVGGGGGRSSERVKVNWDGGEREWRKMV